MSFDDLNDLAQAGQANETRKCHIGPRPARPAPTFGGILALLAVVILLAIFLVWQMIVKDKLRNPPPAKQYVPAHVS